MVLAGDDDAVVDDTVIVVGERGREIERVCYSRFVCHVHAVPKHTELFNFKICNRSGKCVHYFSHI